MSRAFSTHTLVLGLGNPIQGDDGVGLAALARLRNAHLLDTGVRLFEGGTLGLELLPWIEDARRVLVLDAIRTGAPAGTLVVLEDDALPRLFSAKLSPHQIDLREVLALAGLRGALPEEIAAIGLEPESVEMSVSLSPAVAQGLDALVAAAAARLAAWGHEVQARAGVRFLVRGVVQGVGFRPWVVRRARELEVSGTVRNVTGGVRIDAFGNEHTLTAFENALRACDLPAAEVDGVERESIAPLAAVGFEIAQAEKGDTAPSLAADLATCEACAADVATPGARHCAYAFTSCAHCGPRFTIVRDLPWDRSRTGMAEFAPCRACERERHDPASRRFGAEALACPDCGPTLSFVDADGRALAPPERALVAAAAWLCADGIVAVQGVGGFHLACLAGSEAAVSELRRRKRRERKPFAVMAADLDEARRLADLSPAEAALLASPARPIVLAGRRRDAALASGIAPGSPRVGILLPYTPLHHLLLARCGAPLVMTSGNRSGEPIAHRPGDARERLAKVADAFLLHDRPIEGPCDDSVAAITAGAPVLFRRSRGFVPRPLALRRASPAPVLACGAQLQNAFCLLVGRRAVLSAHHGDLDDAAALDAFVEGAARLETLLGACPELFAHDLHPLYASTLYARARAAAQPGAHAVAVQHHHAHVASVLAEHGLVGPVIGVAFDGTGHGAPEAGGGATAWGGEILCTTAAAFERVATFRPLLLVGGDAAIREPWRAALAAVDDAFDGDPPLDRLALFAGIPEARVSAVQTLLHDGQACTPAHGVGRWFDALGALVLGLPVASFQGEVALAWNHAARTADAAPYPFAIDRTRAPVELDLRPLVRAAVADLLTGRPAREIADRFHAALVEATVALVAVAVRHSGNLPVALTGGCFQNALLTEGAVRRLSRNRAVYLNRSVPPGDGGIALGQALVAAERAARGEID